MNKSILSATLVGLLLNSANTSATPFHTMDPRSMGMGGVGVASGNSSQAHFYNPALLVNAPAEEDFNIELDVAARGADSDNMVDGINRFVKQKILTNFINNIEILINSINTANNGGLTSGEITDLIKKRDNLVTSSTDLLDGIHGVANRSLTLNVSGGLSISNPEPEYGWTFFVNVYAPLAAQGNLNPEDDKLMNEFIDVMDVQLNKDDIAGTTQKVQTLLTDLQTKDPTELFKSNVSVYGALIREIGVSYATHTTLNSYSFDFGFTPKILTVEAFDRTVPLNQLELDETLQKSNATKSYNKINLDLGIARKLDDNWKTGLAIKNLLPQDFDTPNGETVKLKPAARIGVNYRNNWVSVGADFDLTENQASAGFDKTRFAAIGAEVDVWLLQLRAGYRMNLANDVSYPAIGLGLYLFGLNLDAAIAGTIPERQTGEDFLDVISGIDDINGSVRVGVNW